MELVIEFRGNPGQSSSDNQDVCGLAEARLHAVSGSVGRNDTSSWLPRACAALSPLINVICAAYCYLQSIIYEGKIKRIYLSCGPSTVSSMIMTSSANKFLPSNSLEYNAAIRTGREHCKAHSGHPSCLWVSICRAADQVY